MPKERVGIEVSLEDKASEKSKKVGANIKKLGSDAKEAGQSLLDTWSKATVVVAGVIAALEIVNSKLHEMTDASIFQNRATLQLTRALQSAPAVLNLNRQSLDSHAQALSKVTKFGDELVTNVQAQLSNFQSFGQDIMPQATEAALNLAERWGGLDDQVKTLGQSLAAPIEGLSALKEKGVIFTTSQQNLVRQLVETNRVFEAQQILLNQIDRQYGGLAEAMGSTSEGIRSRFNNALGDVQEKIGQIFLSLESSWQTSMMPLLDGFLEWIDENGGKIYGIFSNLPQIAELAFTAISEIMNRSFQPSVLHDNFIGIAKLLLTALVTVFENVPYLMVQALGNLPELIAGLLQEGLNAVFGDTRMTFEEAVAQAMEPTTHRRSGRIIQPGLSREDAEIRARALHPEGFQGEDYTNTFLANVSDNMGEVLTSIGENIGNRMGPVLEEFGNNINQNYSDILETFLSATDELVTEGATEFEKQKLRDQGTDLSIGGGSEIIAFAEAITAQLENMVGFGFGTQQTTEAPEGKNTIDLIFNSLGGLDSMFQSLGGRVAELFQGFGALYAEIGPLAFVVVLLKEILNGFFSILGPAINGILTPVLNLLFAIGQMLGQLLLPILQQLTPFIAAIAQIVMTILQPALAIVAPFFYLLAEILQILAPIIVLVSKAFEILSWPLRALADIIYNIYLFITFQWGKLGSSIAGSSSGGSTIQVPSLPDIEDYIVGITAIPGVGDGFGVGGGDTVYGGNAQQIRVPDIYIYQTFQGPIIGEGGMEEFGQMTVDAIQDYIGIGGRVEWLEA